MSRTFALGVLSLLLLLATAPLRAQSAHADSVARDSAAQVLSAVVISATATPVPTGLRGVLARLGARSVFDALRRENRALERQLAGYDRHIARLEAHLDSLKALATAREANIAWLDHSASAMRVRRLQLEARVRELEERGVVVVGERP
ncbi:MAG: hypothetical protein WKG32_20180 [Gemmatimonadaceae bacterium]